MATKTQKHCKLNEQFVAGVQRRLAELDWTQTQLAEAMGVTKAYVSELVLMRRTPGLMVVEKVAAALKTTPRKLFFG